MDETRRRGVPLNSGRWKERQVRLIDTGERDWSSWRRAKSSHALIRAEPGIIGADRKKRAVKKDALLVGY